MKFSSDDLAFFHRQLASMVRIQTPLAEGFGALAKECRKESFRKLVEDVREALGEGRNLSDALAQRPDAFPESYVSLIRAGEASGELGLALEQMADYSETTAAMRKTMVQAALPSCITLLFATGILFFLVHGPLATFEEVFAGLSVSLPTLADFLVQYGDAVCLVLAALCILATALFTLGGARSALRIPGIDLLFLNCPFVGPLLRSSSYTRFSMTLAHLLRHGVPLDQALAHTARIFESPTFRNALLDMKTAVERGESFADQARDSGVFPESLTWKLAFAEKNGNLVEVLSDLHAYFSEHFRMLAARMAQFVHPALVILSSFLVGTVVISCFLPIFRLWEILGA